MLDQGPKILQRAPALSDLERRSDHSPYLVPQKAVAYEIDIDPRTAVSARYAGDLSDRGFAFRVHNGE